MLIMFFVLRCKDGDASQTRLNQEVISEIQCEFTSSELGSDVIQNYLTLT